MVINPDGTIQYEGDPQRLQARGVAGAAPGIDPGVLRAAARNAGNPTPGPSNYVAPQPAPLMDGTTPRPATMPVGENLAPAATAAAATNQTFGQRLMAGLRSGTSLLTRGVGGVQAGMGAADAVQNGLNVNNAEDIGFGAVTAAAPAVGLAGNVLRSGRDFIMKNVIDRAYGQNKTFIPQATPAGPSTAPAGTFPPGVNQPTGVAGAAASNFIDSSAVPQVGQGAMRNNRTGAVTTFNTPPDQVVRAPVAAAAETRVKAPQLGTEGGLFANLAPFVNSRNAAVVDAAYGAQGVNRAVKGATIAKVGIEAENAVSNRITANARAAANSKDNHKLGMDPAGNPVIVDMKNNTAIRPTIKTSVSEADITSTMAKNNMTRAQVLARLKADGKHDLSTLTN